MYKTNLVSFRTYSVLTALTTLFLNVFSICTTDLDIISERVHCIFLRPHNTMLLFIFLKAGTLIIIIALCDQ